MGYKTDHDPRQRATSIGPYTSREMCRALIRQARQQGIPLDEGRVIVSLLTVGEGEEKRAAGAVGLDEDGLPVVYLAENVVLAVGGPGGLYKTSVYPEVHTGAIGLGLAAGAKAQSLPESQYGLASIGFRWNVSGTYMQVIPRFISTDADGVSNPREFLREYFPSVGEMNSMVFLKGYQWPFDSRKIEGAPRSSISWCTSRTCPGPAGVLSISARTPRGSGSRTSARRREYLTRSEALLRRRSRAWTQMNPGAITLYSDHDIDITSEPLETPCARSTTTAAWPATTGGSR